MKSVLLIGAVMIVAMSATTLLWGQRPTRGRILLTTLLAILLGAGAWAGLGRVVGVDADTPALGLLLIVLAAALIMSGRRRVDRAH